MGNKVYWGLGALIILIGAFGFLLCRQYAEIQQLKKGAAESEQVDEPNKQKQTPEVVDVPEVDDRPPPPDDGHEYVWHGDHWDRVDASHAPIVKVSDDTQQQPQPVLDSPEYTGERTYAAYEKYVTEAFQNIKYNEFGLPLSPLPASPPSFRNPEEVDKANRLWNKLSAEYDASITAAAIRMDARYVAPEYTGALTYEAYHNYLAERKKLKEANNE